MGLGIFGVELLKGVSQEAKGMLREYKIGNQNYGKIIVTVTMSSM